MKHYIDPMFAPSPLQRIGLPWGKWERRLGSTQGEYARFRVIWDFARNGMTGSRVCKRFLVRRTEMHIKFALRTVADARGLGAIQLFPELGALELKEVTIADSDECFHEWQSNLDILALRFRIGNRQPIFTQPFKMEWNCLRN